MSAVELHAVQLHVAESGEIARHVNSEASSTVSTVTMRDKANRTVATLKISSAVKREFLKPEERAVIAASLESASAKPVSHHAKVCAPYVTVHEDPATGHFTIDAQTIEVQQLADELTARMGHPIRCHESLSGTVSARVTDTSLPRALERLVGPFGYSIANLNGCTVIGTPEALRYEARRLQDRCNWESAQAVSARCENVSSDDDASTERLPPVQSLANIGPTAAADNVPVASSQPYEITIGNKAKALIAQGDLETTTGLLEEAISRHPDSAILYRMLAEVYLHRSMYHQARTAAQKSLALNRNNPVTNQIYGVVLNRMGDKARGRHYLEQAKYLRSQAHL